MMNEKKLHGAPGPGLQPGVNPAGAWALALGTSIGWGSMVVTGSAYLRQGGPLGSALGLILGAVVMAIVARSYHYMVGSCPEAGGAYSYAREAFGYDYGFLTAWFLMLTYFAMLWANATSLPLFARYFFGDIFRFGRMYTIFNYDVYLGEALLTIAGILLTALLCSRSRTGTLRLMVVLCGIFILGIVICFVAAMAGIGRTTFRMTPAFVPNGKALSQIVRIACISPWAFIGFENISHASEEFSFPRGRTFRILIAAILSATVLYVLVMLLSVSAYPPAYASWLDYIRDVGNLSGLEGLPAFYAANHYLGAFGVDLLIAALLALILTSLIGNTLALSRLFYALARDAILPERFSRLNRRQIPEGAIWLLAICSLAVPFLGRTAIGWIVDVTTIGATLIYGFVCASARKIAARQGDAGESRGAAVGLLCMIVFAAVLLLPNLFSTGSMEKETYFLFVVWSALGFVFFRLILNRDGSGRFGRSIIVWIALLALMLLIALIWMNQSMIESADRTMLSIHEYYGTEGAAAQQGETFIRDRLDALKGANARTLWTVAAMFAFALLILVTNYTYLNRRAKESEAALGKVQSIANTDPLTGVKSKHAFADAEEKRDALIVAGESGAFAVVVCDVNGLKYVNDTFGHKAGDEYIRSASKLICELFAHSPVYRTGGDEFVIVLSGRDYEAREALMAKLQETSIANIAAGAVVISAGLSEFDPATDTRMHMAFERADAKMYQNKKYLKSLGAITRE